MSRELALFVVLGVLLAFGFLGWPLMDQPTVSPEVVRRPQLPDKAEFFAERTRVRLTVPYDMTLAELIRLYQLEQTREGLMRKLDVRSDSVLLRRGQEFEVELMQPLPAVVGDEK